MIVYSCEDEKGILNPLDERMRGTRVESERSAPSWPPWFVQCSLGLVREELVQRYLGEQTINANLAIGQVVTDKLQL
jgi:hypothetical protein